MTSFQQLLDDHYGIISTQQVKQAGLDPHMLTQWTRQGKLVRVQHGVYRRADGEPLSYESLIEICLRIPKAVICLGSALDFHQLTTYVPSHIQIALPRGWRVPEIEYPPIQIRHFSGTAYRYGIEEHQITKHSVRIYSVEKSLADTFYYRNQLGKDIFLEALKHYLASSDHSMVKLIQAAQARRVYTGMKPYLEALG